MKYRYREPHEMKDSGVEWLGMIPKDWEVKKIKRLVREVKGGVWGEDAKKDSNDVPCIRITNFNRTKNIIDIEDLTIRNLDYLKQKDFLLQNGDLLIEKSGGGERQPVGFTCIYNSDLKAIYANFIARVRVKKNIYSPYINFLFSVLYSKKINLRAFNQTTGIQNLSIDKYFDEIVMIPLFSTQQKIADFLDKKCEEFDSVIAKKEMLINKLEEAKKSLISEVVTGKVKVIQKENGEYGIIKREAHEMKDSGVEWLGMIPKEWETIPFKYILNERSEKNTPIKTSERLSLSIDKGVTLYSEKTTNLDRYKEDVSMYKLAYEGDLVLNSMNMIVGAVGISKYFGCVSPAYYTYYDKTKDFYIARYCELILKSERTKKELFSLGKGIMVIDRGEGKFNTIRLKVSREDLNSLKLPMPRLEELKQSTKLIEKKCSQFDLAIRKEKEIIEKLKSAKQSLISEAVTGKIEVL